MYIGSHEYTEGETGGWDSDATAEEIVEHVSGFNITNFQTVNMSGHNGQGFTPIADNPFYTFTTGGLTLGGLSGANFSVTQSNCSG